ncbi:dihydrofolate reductase [Rothia sp. P5764]|uniref:dihydrofolate reductase n=1 Tax=Rothia sp. P5764 TaxID=3402654 RepID=UPI003ABFAEB9
MSVAEKDLPVLGAIWAQVGRGVIGRAGDMPWYAPEDLAHFKQVTWGCPVIMGRATWESFPPRFRPLPGRPNIVISSSLSDPTLRDGATWVPSLAIALEQAAQLAPDATAYWVIGGGRVYAEALTARNLPQVAGGCVSRVERTVFGLELEGDTYAPALDDRWELLASTDTLTSVKGYGLEATGDKVALPYRFESWQLQG